MKYTEMLQPLCGACADYYRRRLLRKSGPWRGRGKKTSDHRAMAEAHLNAAEALNRQVEKVYHEQLAKDCKGLAIGKYCGMKHSH
jgi:hypothetical protein